jgi:hypothetical protein
MSPSALPLWQSMEIMKQRDLFLTNITKLIPEESVVSIRMIFLGKELLFTSPAVWWPHSHLEKR